MIVSDTDPSLAWNAYGGATDGADITLVNNCRPNNTDCTWTIRGDGLIVSNTNLNLAVWANNTGIRLGDPLKLSSRCLVMVQGDCGWQSRATFRWPVRGLSEDDYFDIITNVPGIGEFVVEPEGASDHPTVHKTELETSSRCLGCKTGLFAPTD
jgi:hypothetical protein